MPEKMKVIIDTDIGDDIDDAIALYAAMQQGFEIIGITTVFRNTTDRARQVKKMLRAFGKGYEAVPVFAGYGNPLGTEPQQYEHIPHYTPDLESESFTPDGIAAETAVNFILDSCRKYGKELAIIVIGPFTNLAGVIKKDPDALNSIAKVVIMGGAYYKQYADWNVLCDVAAADVMFRNLKNLECIGADVTHLTVAKDALYDDLMNGKGEDPARCYLRELCRMWRRLCPNAQLVLHDLLAIYYFADPSICVMNSASVAVITDGFARAITLNVDAYGKKQYHPDIYAGFDEKHKTQVASEVDLDAFHTRILRDFDL